MKEAPNPKVFTSEEIHIINTVVKSVLCVDPIIRTAANGVMYARICPGHPTVISKVNAKNWHVSESMEFGMLDDDREQFFLNVPTLDWALQTAIPKLVGLMTEQALKKLM